MKKLRKIFVACNTVNGVKLAVHKVKQKVIVQPVASS